MATRIPHLLEPYLALPTECAHVLLTSVLGASTNWLVLRFLYSLLRRNRDASLGTDAEEGQGGLDGDADTNVILVSFMRDFAFWKEGAGRLGLDLESMARTGRLVFVDGLTGLFTPPQHPPEPARRGRRTLRSAKFADVRQELLAAVSDIAGSRAEGQKPKTVLIVDQPDLLLAATADLVSESGAAAGKETGGLALRNLLLDVQEQVHASIVTASADEPLVAAQHTGLGREHACLVLSLAHSAEAIMSLRLLDTGSASDVSGVMRITRGGGEPDGEPDVEEAELLFFVGGDGSVKMFHRGQGS